MFIKRIWDAKQPGLVKKGRLAMKLKFRLLTKKNQNGFTLVEIAIVLAILGFLTASTVGGIGAFRDSADFKQDERQLKDIKEALLSFVAVNGYLPCPDTDGDGNENRESDDTCTSSNAELPFADLGTHSKNPWGNPYHYLVNQGADSVPASSFASASYFYSDPDCTVSDDKPTPPCFELGTYPVASRSVNDTSSNALEGVGNYDVKVMDVDTNNLVSDAPLVVLSLGSNGCPGVADEEQNNCDAKNGTSQTLYKGQQSRQDNDFFDDALIWLTALEIKRYASGVLSDGLGGNGNGGNGGGDNGDNGSGSSNDITPEVRADEDNFGDYDYSHTQSGGNYNNNHDIETSDDDNRIEIGQNMNKDMDLQGGNNLLDVGNNLNAGIEADDEDNIIRIQGNANGDGIELGDGNNAVEIWGHLNTGIEAGNGDNSIRIEGNLNGSGVELGSGVNLVYVGGNVNSDIDGGGNPSSIFYYNSTSIQDWQMDHIEGFGKIMCRVSTTTTEFEECN
jgi:prepilin-type N-terminal cleavage/methylation domain-containing protein